MLPKFCPCFAGRASCPRDARKDAPDKASSQWHLAIRAKMLRQRGPAQAPLGGKGKSIRGLLGQMAVRATNR